MRGWLRLISSRTGIDRSVEDRTAVARAVAAMDHGFHEELFRRVAEPAAKDGPGVPLGVASAFRPRPLRWDGRGEGVQIIEGLEEMCVQAL